MHVAGVAKEVRPISETKVSGGGNTFNFGSVGFQRGISSKTTHMCRTRVVWDDGTENFADFHPNISVGDRVAIVYMKNAMVAQANINTGESWVAPKTPALGCLVLAIGILFLISKPILGILILGGGLFWAVKSNNDRKALIREELRAAAAETPPARN